MANTGTETLTAGSDWQLEHGLYGEDESEAVERTRRRAGRRARGLGWFSLGLGLAQVAAPRALARLIGLGEGPLRRKALRAIGVRELAAGLGLVARPRPGWLWTRVAGDVMDLVLLGRAVRSRRADRGRVTAALTTVAGVTILDVLVGRQLGRALSRKRPHARTVVQALTVEATPEQAYRLWRNFENLPRFMAHLESVRVRNGGRSHWVVRGPADKRIEWDAEIAEDRPNELISWRSLPGAAVAHSGVVRFKRAPGDRGTEIRVEMDVTTPVGTMGATLAKLFGKDPEQQVKGDLRRLKQVLETGEVVHSDASLAQGSHPARPWSETERRR